MQSLYVDFVVNLVYIFKTLLIFFYNGMKLIFVSNKIVVCDNIIINCVLQLKISTSASLIRNIIYCFWLFV